MTYFDSIELTDKKISKKIQDVSSCVKQVNDIITKCKYDLYFPYNLYVNDINEIEENYKMSISHILINYYSDKNKEHVLTQDYNKIIVSNNFISSCDHIIKELRITINKLFQTLDIYNPQYVQLEKATKLLKSIDNIVLGTNSKRVNYEICSCGKKMFVQPHSSTLICECGLIKELLGTVFEDYQFYNQDGQKTKHGNYEPLRQLKIWLDRILATEKVEIPEKILNKVRQRIKQYGDKNYQINCEKIRGYLKECDLTTYNVHVSMIYKLITKNSPPHFNYHDRKHVCARFCSLLRFLKKIDSKIEGDIKYYPYFIYKICEADYAHDPDKLIILDFIHIQSHDTVSKNDEIYKEACSISSGEFTYISTPI